MEKKIFTKDEYKYLWDICMPALIEKLQEVDGRIKGFEKRKSNKDPEFGITWDEFIKHENYSSEFILSILGKLVSLDKELV